MSDEERSPARIGRKDPTKIVLEWRDGSVSEVMTPSLRRACPCAKCVDEHTGAKILDPRSVPDDLTHVEVHLVGRYALGVTFSDHHRTGIFTWDTLRRVGARPE